MVWGAIAAVVTAQLIGAFFYSPMFLGNVWMKAAFPGHSQHSIGDQAGTSYAVTLMASSAIALMLHFILVNFFHVKAVLDAVKFAGGLAVLGALIDIPHLAFSRRSLVAFLIDHAFNIASLISMAVCIFYFS